MVAVRLFGSLLAALLVSDIVALVAVDMFSADVFGYSNVQAIVFLGIAVPLGYFWTVRPLLRELREKTTAIDSLRRSLDDMAARIKERDREVEIAQRILKEAHAQLDGALNNMHQGLCMYDAEMRLVLCNPQYREMYSLPENSVKPGATFREILESQIETGNFHQDPDLYIESIIAANARGETVEGFARLKDRTLRILTKPLPSGGWVATHEDVTEKHRAETELANARNFLDQVIEHVPATILVKDAKTLQYILLNQAGVDFFGLTREQIIGKTAYDFFPKDVADALTKRDRDLLDSGEQYFYDDRPFHRTGNKVRHVATKRLVIGDANGQPAYVLGVIEDITKRKTAELEIIRLAHHDPLTDLPNRAAFNKKLAESLEAAAANNTHVAVTCIDLDRFKEINDVYGHAAGDALLQEVSRRLQRAVGDGFLARIGGDEFILISTEGEQSAASVTEAAGKLLSTVATDVDVGGHSLSIGMSIGVAIFPKDGADATSLMCNADAALYRAKAEGRNTVRLFAPEMDASVRERSVMQRELRTAISNGEFNLHYQPLAQISGEIVGFEALVRWNHPVRGPVPPSTFIPLAEESSLIMSIGEWVLRDACREAAAWPRPLQLAVNLSPVQFRQGDLAALVHSILLETGLSPSRLELEITESVLVGDLPRATAMLRRLKSLGVRISMDDFGTGYSSLSYLQAFPFDKIKIDRAFISNVERNQQSAAIVRAVIGLGRNLNVPVVAEGVENQEQLDFLRHESCDQMQGHLLGRPGPIETYAQTLGRPAPEPAIEASVIGASAVA